MNNQSEILLPRAADPQGKQPYEAPQLRELGDVRDLTLGGSPGTGDSGSAATQQF